METTKAPRRSPSDQRKESSMQTQLSGESLSKIVASETNGKRESAGANTTLAYHRIRVLRKIEGRRIERLDADTISKLQEIADDAAQGLERRERRNRNLIRGNTFEIQDLNTAINELESNPFTYAAGHGLLDLARVVSGKPAGAIEAFRKRQEALLAENVVLLSEGKVISNVLEEFRELSGEAEEDLERAKYSSDARQQLKYLERARARMIEVLEVLGSGSERELEGVQEARKARREADLSLSEAVESLDMAGAYRFSGRVLD